VSSLLQGPIASRLQVHLKLRMWGGGGGWDRSVCTTAIRQPFSPLQIAARAICLPAKCVIYAVPISYQSVTCQTRRERVDRRHAYRLACSQGYRGKTAPIWSVYDGRRSTLPMLWQGLRRLFVTSCAALEILNLNPVSPALLTRYSISHLGGAVGDLDLQHPLCLMAVGTSFAKQIEPFVPTSCR